MHHYLVLHSPQTFAAHRGRSIRAHCMFEQSSSNRIVLQPILALYVLRMNRLPLDPSRSQCWGIYSVYLPWQPSLRGSSSTCQSYRHQRSESRHVPTNSNPPRRYVPLRLQQVMYCRNALPVDLRTHHMSQVDLSKDCCNNRSDPKSL